MAAFEGRERLYFIDWLRVFAVLLLVPFHTGMMFVRWGFHIENTEKSGAVELFNGFLGIWHMPLLILLSGAGSWFALNHRGPGGYLRERFLRLVVPLVFGILVVVPPQVYCERLAHGEFSGSFLAFWPHIFNGVYPEGNFSYHHLWFLAYLFTYCVLALPIFVWLRPRLKRPEAFAWMKRPVALLALSLPTGIVYSVLLVPYHGQQNFVDDWSRYFAYLILFIYGFALFAGDAVETIQRWRRLYLLLAVVCVFSIKIMEDSGLQPDWGYNPHFILLFTYRIFVAWCWMLAIVGYGRQYLDFSHPVLTYANEAVLPFYVLHQTIIVVIGYFVIQQTWGVAAKYFFILILAFILTLAAYEFLIRRFNVPRVLFGMRMKNQRVRNLPVTSEGPS